MTRSRLQRVSKYKFHKSSGHAFVTIAGRNHFLGNTGPPPAARRKQSWESVATRGFPPYEDK